MAQGRTEEGVALIVQAAETAEPARGADDRQAVEARELLTAFR